MQRKDLAAKARAVGLLGGIVRDLSAREYKPSDPLYRETLDAVMGIFDRETSRGVPFADRSMLIVTFAYWG